MEKTRKNLKTISIVILIFAGLTLLGVIGEICFGDLNKAEIPEGSPENILLITKIFLLSLTVVLVLPQVYVGVKGIKFANAPDSSKAHIVWAIILFAFSVVTLISPLSAIFKGGDVFDNVSLMCSTIVEAVMFFEYVVTARAVSKGK